MEEYDDYPGESVRLVAVITAVSQGGGKDLVLVTADRRRLLIPVSESMLEAFATAVEQLREGSVPAPMLS